MRNFNILGKQVPAIFLILLLCVAIGTASLLTYYGVIKGTITVEQSVLVDGKNVDTGSLTIEELPGDVHTLENTADEEVPIIIETTYDPELTENEITTIYKSEITLTEKVVDFSKDVWEIPTWADTVTVEYTLVGDSFTAEVIEEDAIEGYVLIYYKDNSDRFNSPAKAILIDDVEGNLPYNDDANTGEYDYCATEEYKTCFGAKIWYVPEDAIIEDELNWARASEFYYETELIQYNADGQLTLYPDNTLSFSIVNGFNVALTPGTYLITTNILPL